MLQTTDLMDINRDEKETTDAVADNDNEKQSTDIMADSLPSPKHKRKGRGKRKIGRIPKKRTSLINGVDNESCDNEELIKSKAVRIFRYSIPANMLRFIGVPRFTQFFISALIKLG